MRYYYIMIKSIKCKETQSIYEMKNSRRFPKDIHQRIYMKLRMLNNAVCLDDLRVPPSNHLEKLSGDRGGQYSMRVNHRWRICFIWHNNDAYEVEVVDYH